ncbi:MAG TPA: hypothetical protein VJZ00_00085 [Thermoanaerobaculia bacterium]|nr:hypothetical protein [Thermoanaerobaculia bacterium]
MREVKERGEEARAFYQRFGVRREGWFYQQAQDGAFVIGVTDIADPVEPKAEEYAAEEEGFAAWFKSRVYALSGVDPDTAPLGAVTEQVHASKTGPLARGATLIVRAYPIRNREALLDFARELREKPRDARGFYERHGVEESWFVQDIGGAPMAIAVASTDDPDRAARTFAESQDPFDVWFKQRVIEVSGVDPNVTPLGPPSEQIFDFEE